MKGKSKKIKPECISPTWPQPCLAGVGNVNSFFSLLDLFLFFKAWAAAAATGIWHLVDYGFRN